MNYLSQNKILANICVYIHMYVYIYIYMHMYMLTYKDTYIFSWVGHFSLPEPSVSAGCRCLTAKNSICMMFRQQFLSALPARGCFPPRITKLLQPIWTAENKDTIMKNQAGQLGFRFISPCFQSEISILWSREEKSSWESGKGRGMHSIQRSKGK